MPEVPALPKHLQAPSSLVTFHMRKVRLSVCFLLLVCLESRVWTVVVAPKHLSPHSTRLLPHQLSFSTPLLSQYPINHPFVSENQIFTKSDFDLSMSAIAAAPDDLGLTWRSWESVGVRVENLPHDATTFDLWRAFNNEGNIISIDIFEKPDGFQSSSGRIRFMYVSTRYAHILSSNLLNLCFLHAPFHECSRR